MKKSLFKNITSVILTLSLVSLLCVSCSPDDSPAQEPDPAVVFSTFNVSQTDVFVEDKILIEMDGSGYTDTNLVSDNPAVVITKVSPTLYKITSASNASAYIYATLSNKTNKANKGVNVSFNEHGVKDFKSIEGIKVNADKAAKVTSLLGNPDQKTDSSTSTTIEIWDYTAKGLSVLIDKNTSIVQQISLLSSNYYITKDGAKISFSNYPYEIGYDWKINDAATTMDMVVNKLGTPDLKSTSASSANNRSYKYVNKQMSFNFYSDSEDNYTGKKIIYFSIY